MTDDVFRQRKKIDIENDIESNPFDKISEVQKKVADATNKSVPPNLQGGPIQIGGNIPKEFMEIFDQKEQAPLVPPSIPQGTVRMKKSEEDKVDIDEELFKSASKKMPNQPVPSKSMNSPIKTGSSAFEQAMEALSGRHMWEEFSFPSLGKFYDGIPASIHIRAMTGQEEQILATQRYVKKNLVIDKIFESCIRENIDTRELLSEDRNHLLIYLRGISYTPNYDVEIRCPSCTNKFSTIINLDQMMIDLCPEDFNRESLKGTLPESGMAWEYRLSTGYDEQAINTYREKKVSQWGAMSEDDTLLYRSALLIEHIAGVTDKKELLMLLKKLPILDVSHIRNEIVNPPFGVDTNIEIICPICAEEFEIDLPMEIDFFFPRKKKVE